jgi:hypothetical protein
VKSHEIIARLFSRNDIEEDATKWFLIPHTEGPTILAESNRATILGELEDDEDGTPRFHDFGTDGIVARVGYEAAEEWVDSLDDYCVADESDFSEREHEEEMRSWDDYGRDDMRREMKRYLRLRLDWLRVDPDHEMSVDDTIDALTDGQIDTIYHAQIETVCGGESVIWEEDYDGSHAAFHVDRAVWGYNQTERDAREGRWDSEAWDGLVPALDDAGNVEYTTGDVAAWIAVVAIDQLTGPKCHRCGAHAPKSEERDEWPLGLWYEDCGDLVCDVPSIVNTPCAQLAYKALLGDKGSLAVLQDAAEEHGWTKTADELRGRQGGWTLREELGLAYQKAALKRIAAGTVG